MRRRTYTCTYETPAQKGGRNSLRLAEISRIIESHDINVFAAPELWPGLTISDSRLHLPVHRMGSMRFCIKQSSVPWAARFRVFLLEIAWWLKCSQENFHPYGAAIVLSTLHLFLTIRWRTPSNVKCVSQQNVVLV